MAQKDPAWGVFRQELITHMKRESISNGKLAEIVGVGAETVRSWVSFSANRGTPTLALLPAIAAALRMGNDAHRQYDPLYLPRAMGIIPTPTPDQIAEAVDLSYRIQKIQLKLDDLADLQADQARIGGATGVARACSASDRWAVAIWPAYEGPAYCRLHVADRVDITRTDPRNAAPLTADEVWSDPDLKEALIRTRAVRSERTPRWRSNVAQSVSTWSVPYVGTPMLPATSSAYAAKSIAFIATTVGSWVNDVAALVAMAIGYGLSTTRDLAMDIYGIGPHAQGDAHRLASHGRLLQQPIPRRCWSHHSVLGHGWHDLFTPPDGRPGQGTEFVWLRETDALLALYAERRGIDLAVLVDSRDSNDRAARLNDLLILEVGTTDDVPSRWDQVFEGVRTVLEHGHSHHWWPSDLSSVRSRVSRRYPSVADHFLDWVTAEGL